MSSWTFGEQSQVKVDREKGIIYNVAVVTEGEAKGHGFNVDNDFLHRTAELGNSARNGIRMRFGHPTMCSTALGTFMGRAKNFRVDGKSTRADAFLSKEAKEAPGGNLYDYVLGMAENEPDAFGLSIVFKPGKKYKRDKDGEKEYGSISPDDKVFIENESMTFVDFVDTPAANEDGLFSAFNNETMAGQVSEFLDTHPQVWEVLDSRPDILKEFLGRYKEYLEAKGKSFDVLHINESVDSKPASVGAETTKKEKNNMEDRDLFKRMKSRFGTEVAAQVFEAGGDMNDAEKLSAEIKFAALENERNEFKQKAESLSEKVEELEAKLSEIVKGEETPVKVQEVEEEVKEINCQALIDEYRSQGLGVVEAQDKVIEAYPEEYKKQFGYGA